MRRAASASVHGYVPTNLRAFVRPGVQYVDAKYAGKWELPALGEVGAPAAVLVRPGRRGQARAGDRTPQRLTGSADELARAPTKRQGRDQRNAPPKAAPLHDQLSRIDANGEPLHRRGQGIHRHGPPGYVAGNLVVRAPLAGLAVDDERDALPARSSCRACTCRGAASRRPVRSFPTSPVASPALAPVRQTWSYGSRSPTSVPPRCAGRL